MLALPPEQLVDVAFAVPHHDHPGPRTPRSQLPALLQPNGIYFRLGRELRHCGPDCEASSCLCGLLGLGGLVGGPPFAGGLARFPRIGAAGTLALAAVRDAGEHAPDGLAQRGRVLQ